MLGMMETAMEPSATNSLERALKLLDLIERAPGGLNNAELSRQLRIPKSTCSYITKRLIRAGYLTRDEDSRQFRMGLRVVSLAYGALREVGIRSIAEPALYKLTTETGLSAGVGVLQNGRVLLIDRVEGPRFVTEAMEAADGGAARRNRYRTREQRDVGRELPVHSTALGKVLLAQLSRQQVVNILGETSLARRTPQTIVSRTKLLAELDVVRQQGFARADEEEYAGVRALSAPIVDATGIARAAISVNGSPAEQAWSNLPELIQLVQAAARDIARRMRFPR
jgi:IclR family transcriptional regulator, KDG regulon repressor